MLQVSQSPLPDSQDTLQVSVASAVNISSDVRLLSLQACGDRHLPSATPGSHIDVHLPNGLIRQYSLLECGENLSSYQIAVKRMQDGEGGSIAIHDEVGPGSQLVISSPRNNFPLSEEGDEYLFIAGGIGITPIWSMLNHIERLGRPWELHYAVRFREDVLFGEEWSKFSDRVHLYTDHETPPTSLDLAKLLARTGSNARIYCCGPGPMLLAFRDLTTDRPPGFATIEAFKSLEVADRQGGFTVELARSNLSLVIEEGQSILEALLEAGIDIPSSCRDGVCGTCETRVLGGIPDHRDAYLSEEEREAGDRIMVCCSGCAGDRLVLDL